MSREIQAPCSWLSLALWILVLGAVGCDGEQTVAPDDTGGADVLDMPSIDTMDTVADTVPIVEICDPDCVGDFTCCNGECVDVNSRLEHCGACNRPCLPGRECVNAKCGVPCSSGCSASQVCSLGFCAGICDSGLTECGTDCIDVFSDPNHCGGCNIVCEASEICAFGSVVTSVRPASRSAPGAATR